MVRDTEERKAKYRYIVYNGVLGWGVSVGLFAVGYSHFIQHEHTSWKECFETICTFMIGGILYGWIMWKFDQYQKKKGQS